MGSEMCIRDRFRFHGAVVGFVDRCLSRTRNLAASNKHLAEFFSGRSWPKIGPGIIFFGVFEKFETFFSKICAHIASGTEIFWWVSLKFQLFVKTSRSHCHRYNYVFFSRFHGKFKNSSILFRVLLNFFLLGKILKIFSRIADKKPDKAEHRAGARYEPCAPRIATPHCTR